MTWQRSEQSSETRASRPSVMAAQTGRQTGRRGESGDKEGAAQGVMLTPALCVCVCVCVCVCKHTHARTRALVAS